MDTLTFDTHGFVKRLTAAGMPEAQAEVLVEEQTNLIENNLATKRDLKKLEVASMQNTEFLRRDLTIRLGAMLVTSIAIVAALIKLL